MIYSGFTGLLIEKNHQFFIFVHKKFISKYCQVVARYELYSMTKMDYDGSIYPYRMGLSRISKYTQNVEKYYRLN